MVVARQEKQRNNDSMRPRYAKHDKIDAHCSFDVEVGFSRGVATGPSTIRTGKLGTSIHSHCLKSGMKIPALSCPSSQTADDEERRDAGLKTMLDIVGRGWHLARASVAVNQPARVRTTRLRPGRKKTKALNSPRDPE